MLLMFYNKAFEFEVTYVKCVMFSCLLNSKVEESISLF